MPLKHATIRVTDVTGDIGNRWKDKQTFLIIKPSDPPTKGTWDSDRSIDIDSAAGTDHATYQWERKYKFLFVQTSGYQGDTRTKTPLTLLNFNEIKCGARGDGKFYFRGKDHPVSWEMILLTHEGEYKRCD